MTFDPLKFVSGVFIFYYHNTKLTRDILQKFDMNKGQLNATNSEELIRITKQMRTVAEEKTWELYG